MGRYSDELREMQKDLTCLELVKEVVDIIDGFYLFDNSGLGVIAKDLKQRSGEISVLSRQSNLLKLKLEQLDHNLGSGLL